MTSLGVFKRMEIKVRLPKGFDLEKSVCNHGFFMMAPNRWMPCTKTLVRPLRLPDHSSVTVSISQPSATSLSITVVDDRIIYVSQRQAITDQVKRMLRLSDADVAQLEEFHNLHVDAAQRGFGRIFRNPSLFEDLAKSLLLCASPFQKSLKMAEAMCVLQKRLNLREGVVDQAKRGRKRKSYSVEESWGNFPSAQELALILPENEKLLSENCMLKYRAVEVLSLAEDVRNGKLAELEKLCDVNEVYAELMGMKGFGEFVVGNALMCMGFYHKIPADSETVRLLKQVHQRQDCTKKNMKVMAAEIYDKYAPFQTLAYWLEMVDYYEINLGKLSLLDRCCYKNVAGSAIDKPSRKNLHK